MRNSRFFYLYLVAGFAALALLIYHVSITYPRVKYSSVISEVILVILFFYLANKTYHEKKDKELM